MACFIQQWEMNSIVGLLWDGRLLEKAISNMIGCWIIAVYRMLTDWIGMGIGCPIDLLTYWAIDLLMMTYEDNEVGDVS